MQQQQPFTIIKVFYAVFVYCIYTRSKLIMKKLYFTTVVFSGCIFLCSCKDEYSICNLSKDVRFTAGFYKKVGLNDVVSPAPRFTLSLLNSGTSSYTQQANVEIFSLPLSPVVDSVKYVLKLDTGLQADTVTITYTSKGENLSVECGSVVYNTITQITSTVNTIKSVNIIKALVNTEPLQNVKIFY